ncbi:hypothetical protein HDF16_002974 [Granulicella aggregans]|uniref:Uncharacterized protein n=1 Tax=Granulicella aggregans TaxID=474949 RepID=A0A7W7ZE73_9BACT|nr:hypothetical protein [Granulicella aggregans]MBB5058260.1 hypothetical protein [Granulicella aggregans]
MEQTQTNPALEAAARLLRRIGIDRFVAAVRGQGCEDYRMQTMSES